MTDHSEDRVTIWLSEDLRDNVEERVDWRYSSLSEWMRDAARYRMYVEDAASHAGLDLPEDEADRAAVLRDVAFAGADAVAGDE